MRAQPTDRALGVADGHCPPAGDSVWPHGALLAVDARTLTILQAAGDTALLLGSTNAECLGQSLDAWLSPGQTARLRAVAQDAGPRQPRHLLDPVLRVLPGRPADASVHVSEGILVIEWEPADPRQAHDADPLSMVQSMLEDLPEAPSIDAAWDYAVQSVQQATGYGSVTAVRWQDGVLLPPLLPDDQDAYLKSWVRYAPDVAAEPVALVPPVNPLTGRALDISMATLRGGLPLRREAIRTADARAALCVSVRNEDALSGVIVGLDREPNHTPRGVRAACELFGAMFSLKIEALEQAEALHARLMRHEALQAMMRSIILARDYGSGLVAQMDQLLDYIPATGLVLRIPERSDIGNRVESSAVSRGHAPPEDFVAALTDWLDHQMEYEDIFATDGLAEHWPAARGHGAAGVLAVSVSREPRDYIIWFRAALPGKAGAAAWSANDLEAANDLRGALLDLVLRRTDIAAQEQMRAREQQQTLIAELDTWVNNTLKVIQGLLGHSGRSGRSLSGYVAGLERRIRAIARSHSLLTQRRWEGVSLRSLLREEIEEISHPGGAVTLNGADLILTPQATLALSLVISELAMNAASYGALSAPGGRLDVSWVLNSRGDMDMHWVESGGPSVRPPKARGFGSLLIERALSMEAGAYARLRFIPHGVQCDIKLPMSAIVSVLSPTGYYR